MSLDVYLTTKKRAQRAERIFVRDAGGMREISREEWDELNPGVEPVVVSAGETDEVYFRNITHNLSEMANDAGIYGCLWRPEENGIGKASQLIEPLRNGLALLESDPDRFRKFDPENGWGEYGDLVEFVRDYLKACEEHPDAEVRVSR